MSEAFFTHIAKSLGRASVPATIPEAPKVDESIARLIRADVTDLVAKFIDQATVVKMSADLLANEGDLSARLVDYLRAKQLTRLVITRCELFDRLEVVALLRQDGFDVNYWDDIGLDRSYDVDAGITDVFGAVAETGSLVMKRSRAGGLAASLVPMTHVAIVRREQICADLIDLMSKLQQEGTGSGVTIITGPSKTADIEMNLVTGVHGPGVVRIFVV